MDREALNDFPMGRYDVTVKIVTFAPDREIAWTILGQIKPPLGHVYGYRLEPVDGGTLVTSYYDWSAIDATWREADVFPIIPESALRATLGILERTVRLGWRAPRALDHGVVCRRYRTATRERERDGEPACGIDSRAQ